MENPELISISKQDVVDLVGIRILDSSTCENVVKAGLGFGMVGGLLVAIGTAVAPVATVGGFVVVGAQALGITVLGEFIGGMTFLLPMIAIPSAHNILYRRYYGDYFYKHDIEQDLFKLTQKQACDYLTKFVISKIEYKANATTIVRTEIKAKAYQVLISLYNKKWPNLVDPEEVREFQRRIETDECAFTFTNRELFLLKTVDDRAELNNFFNQNKNTIPKPFVVPPIVKQGDISLLLQFLNDIFKKSKELVTLENGLTYAFDELVKWGEHCHSQGWPFLCPATKKPINAISHITKNFDDALKNSEHLKAHWLEQLFQDAQLQQIHNAISKLEKQPLSKCLQEMKVILSEYKSMQLMQDPVVLSHGIAYSKKFIANSLTDVNDQTFTCPQTGLMMKLTHPDKLSTHHIMNAIVHVVASHEVNIKTQQSQNANYVRSFANSGWGLYCTHQQHIGVEPKSRAQAREKEDEDREEQTVTVFGTENLI